MFWGGARLRKELKSLISDFKVGRIDHASYRLRIGSEVYVSPTGEPDDPRNKPKKTLAPGEGFTIPAGQFGFILTEETVRVPNEAMAFISIRAGYKFRGLVNVSGFHIDPNYEGHLIFSVFNAGPGPIHLSRGEPCFLIWYADLDQPFKEKKRTGYSSIPSELTGPIAGGLESFASLHSKINDNDKKINELVSSNEKKINDRVVENDKKMSERVSKVESDNGILKFGNGLLVALLIVLVTKNCSGVQWANQKPVGENVTDAANFSTAVESNDARSVGPAENAATPDASKGTVEAGANAVEVAPGNSGS